MNRSAVLLSGGLDSAVLAAMERANGFEVWPVHVRAGFAWEQGEADAIRRLLASPSFARDIQPLTTLTVDMRDVYPAGHWGFSGEPPAYDSPDEAVFLAGRNIVLTTKTAVFARQHAIDRIALGPLAGNPFPDATPEFFDAMSTALARGLNAPIRIVTPLLMLSKVEVIRRGATLGVPMERTLSCLRPAGETHCGACNKCRERQEAFAAAGIVDRTAYARSQEG